MKPTNTVKDDTLHQPTAESVSGGTSSAIGQAEDPIVPIQGRTVSPIHMMHGDRDLVHPSVIRATATSFWPSDNKQQGEWKIPGGARRASHADVTSYSKRAILSGTSTTPPPGFERSRLKASPVYAMTQSAATSPPKGDVPIFEFFGGRSHGHRSFSFSVGPKNDDQDEAGTHDNGASLTSGSRAVPNRRMPLEAKFQSAMEEPDIILQRSRSKSSSHIFGDFDDQEQHRNSSGIQQDALRDIWSRSPVSPNNLPLSNGPTGEMAYRRRATMAHDTFSAVESTFAKMNLQKNMTPVYAEQATPHSSMWKTTQVENGYDMQGRFGYREGDQRRTSMTLTANNRRPSALSQSHGNNGVMLEESMAVPNDFAVQYGSLVQDAAAYVRRRSMSVSSGAMVSPSSEKALARTLTYVVEFKGGRQDVFRVRDECNFEVSVGDLVIVEADRGEDLGKVVSDKAPIAVESKEATSPAEKSSSAPQSAKLIIRLAEADEINALLDKARDEAKCLSVIQAKVRQKNLPMEVIDAEFQWDRRKLTFHFVSESRIDFRDLVKDLFKIYKTRIWMCAVERSRNGVRLLR